MVWLGPNQVRVMQFCVSPIASITYFQTILFQSSVSLTRYHFKSLSTTEKKILNILFKNMEIILPVEIFFNSVNNEVENDTDRMAVFECCHIMTDLRRLQLIIDRAAS